MLGYASTYHSVGHSQAVRNHSILLMHGER